MTDEELIKRLREPWFTNGCERYQRDAADRIEALVKDAKAQESEIANLGENLDAQKRRAERLEAALRKIDVGEGWAAQIAREALK